ncbi:MAG: hypothetical protein ACP5R5_03110 [Armatimonadota bacterium]
MTKHALGILFVVLIAQAGAWGAVTVSWTDSAGPHSVELSCLWNPEYDGTPWSLEPKYAWQGQIYVVMDSFGPIKFTFSGNFYGAEGFDYGIWYGVRVEQTVLNHTGAPWNGFNVWTENLVPDPNPARDPTFYNMYSYEPSDWWVDMYPMTCSFYAEEPLVGPFVANDETFYDVLKVNSDYDPATGDGGFYLYKQAVAVPEPGAMTTAAGCLVGLLAYARRRKAQ